MHALNDGVSLGSDLVRWRLLCTAQTDARVRRHCSKSADGQQKDIGQKGKQVAAEKSSATVDTDSQPRPPVEQMDARQVDTLQECTATLSRI